MDRYPVKVQLQEEDDGRWIAEVVELPGVLVYGNTPGEALTRAQVLARRVIADRLENGESTPELRNVFGA